MLLEIKDGSVSFGDKVVLNHADFFVRGTEKIAVVGRNGCGKTTLLRVLAGDLQLDTNEKNPESGMHTSRTVTIETLSQQVTEDGSLSVREYVASALPDFEDAFSPEHFAASVEFDRIYTGLGMKLEDKDKPLSAFSGGEQTKIALARLLLLQPDILLLDEPTNHLDEKTVLWLEEELRHYEKAVVMVSHDRYFLDRAADVVCELEGGKITRYPGNYTHYRQERSASYARQLAAWERQQAEEKRLKDLIERFKHKPNKAAFARSRKKILDRMPRVEKPIEDRIHIHTGDIEPLNKPARWIFAGEDLEIGYGKPLLKCTFRVPRGARWAVWGENGSGKTTLLRTLAGELPPVKGRLSVGNRVEIGYFDQQSAAITSELSVQEWFLQHFPALTEKDVRQTLAEYLFRSNDLGRRVSDLSGGEKARLVLAKLLTERPNVLLLDEPTNHMDIPARETIESLLMSYTGTILLVSHDRYLVSRVANSLLLTEKGQEEILFYPFGYEHYTEHRLTADRAWVNRRTMKEQAMIESLRAVPRGERGRLREISTESAYREWKSERAAEDLQAAQDAWLKGLFALSEDSEELFEKYTRACICWDEVTSE